MTVSSIIIPNQSNLVCHYDELFFILLIISMPYCKVIILKYI
ncbi:hypothetical protein SAMN05216323_100413 [Williamwhitmania taraxaci]|uniref:Uncharacterized protein n=1 Tax=Williamwhitmania taraxaci TaxID=1640674 RepID=A0A1G6GW50_9BACT|nr:hypothetical protein SAMN05216323_100413 [Williamwhitmania taraxaci]